MNTMNNRICLVTGANRGIGKATAMGLAKKNARVVMACRSREQGECARLDIIQKSGNTDITLLIADLSSQKAVRGLADEYKSRFNHLHVLINNAGIITPERTITVDGLETQFAVNHLAPFLLSNLLLTTLKKSAPSRIITVSSLAERMGTINFDNLQSKNNYSPVGAYSQTKVANVIFAYELAERLEGTGITSNCLTPGIVGTDMLREFYGMSKEEFAGKIKMYNTPEEGAEASIYLASSPEVETVTGKYFQKQRACRTSDITYDAGIAHRLWQISEELTGLNSGR